MEVQFILPFIIMVAMAQKVLAMQPQRRRGTFLAFRDPFPRRDHFFFESVDGSGRASSAG